MVLVVEWLGEPLSAALLGGIVGLIFGFSAEQSRFCLRAAAVEIARGQAGPRFGVWLLAFSTAVLWTQAGDALGFLSLAETRWLATPGTLSGAILGGAMFGVGMILSRGCPGRLLVLGATGNLRAMLSGLVFAVVAQMSLHGMLSPLRVAISGAVTTQGPNPDILALLSLPDGTGIVFALSMAALALVIARWNRISPAELIFGCGIGFAVATGWFLTFGLSQVSFDPVAVESLTFSGPSADTLMMMMQSGIEPDFDVGLVPGVGIAAFLSALVSRRLQWQGWSDVHTMHRSLAGAALMGFGAMTAGGCTIGAGVTGGSTFALTAWVALTAMWVSGMVADWLIDRAEQTSGTDKLTPVR